MNVEFLMSLRIIDQDMLVKAAVEQAIAEGLEEDYAQETYTVDNLKGCLVMLLDPGALPGCEVEVEAEILSSSGL